MSFAIEVPAESVPLSTETLYKILQSSTSDDQQQVQTGAQQLQNWEKTPGFYSSLQSLYLNYSLPVKIRYLAVIQLKNGVDKYWRKTATNAIRPDEKATIRSRCLQSAIEEPDHRLALQISLSIAKVVRHDYPHDWSDIFDKIINSLRSHGTLNGNPNHLYGTQLVLLYIVKELSTAKLQRSRVQLQYVAPEIVNVLSTVYLERVNIWLTAIANQNDDDLDKYPGCVSQSLLALRILRRLIIAAYDFPNRDPRIRDLWGSLLMHFSEILNLLGSTGGKPIEVNLSSADECTKVEAHLIQITKLHLGVAKSQPAGFALLPDAVYLAEGYWSIIKGFSRNYGLTTTDLSTGKIGAHGDVEEPSLLERIALQGLLILRACAKMVFNPAQTFKYQRDEDKEEKKLAKQVMMDELFSAVFAAEVMQTLVTKFFVFTSRDLKEWEEEPDEWEKSQEGGGEDWEFSIRTCAEKLFLDLILNFQELLVPPLLIYFESVAKLGNEDVMLKDSIYGAVGLAAPVLEHYPETGFGSFLENTLVNEVQIQQPGYNILRRRAAIMLGQWLPVEETLNRPLVYQIFQHLLNRSDNLNDQVVRVTAARQLKNVIDPFEFNPTEFEPFAVSILQTLLDLTGEVELPDTKIAILATISTIVCRMEQSIKPYADFIISLLPALWNQAGKEYLMKQRILGILSSLCAAVRTESRGYHPLVLPLIKSSTEPNSETGIYLLEDALDLWATVMVQVTSEGISPDIVALIPNLFPLYESLSEGLRKGLEITELYIHLIPSVMLSYTTSLLGALVPILRDANREASGLITSVTELLIRYADNLGGLPAVTELTQTLLHSQLISVILSGLNDAYRTHQTPGPKKISVNLDGVVETDYFNILSRLAIADPQLLFSAVAASSYIKRSVPYFGTRSRATEEILGSNDPSAEQKMSWLLTEWIDHMDQITNPASEKLNILALTSMFSTGQPWMLSHLQSLMDKWINAVTNLVVDVSLDANVVENRDSLVYNDINALRSEDDTPADERRRLLNFKDPVHRLDIAVYVREKLEAGIAASGGMEEFQSEWVTNVDKDVLAAFGALGIM
ncbi:hypothetical protein ACLMJK_008647 [Lecanora helva]